MAGKTDGRQRPKGQSGHTRAAPRKPATVSAEPMSYTIERLGLAGEGLGYPEGGAETAAPSSDAVFIPYTAPGDRVLAVPTGSGRARLNRVVTPSPLRVTPPCSLFGECGGCALQHLSTGWALDWKVEQVMAGLIRAGFDAPPAPHAVQTLPSTRRRADFALREQAGHVTVGLHRRGGDAIDLSECHVLHPDIMAVLPDLRTLLPRLTLLRGRGDLLVNRLDSGLDLLFTTTAQPSTADRTRLAEFAKNHGIPRIGWRPDPRGEPETVVQIAPVRHRFAEVTVEPPLGAFLQATIEGEAAIRDAVLGALPPSPPRKARVVELYAGCGTLTFPLAERVRVEAFEGHPAALRCLQSAAGGQRVTGTVRDLNRQPVDAKMLAGAVAVVLDPPHAGPGAQFAALLDARPEVIVYVSCNPQALWRDARALHSAGYALDAVTVVDQFLWSPDVETVCRFSRKATRSKR